MVIKRSAGQEVQALIDDLDADDDVRREAAVARLAVIGTRAVDRLLAVLERPAGGPARAGALRALESIGDARAVAPALSLLDTPEPDLAAAAASVARRFLAGKQGTLVLDRLVAIALDPQRPEPARLAALDAMSEVGKRVLTPIWERLRTDPSVAVQQRAARETGQVDPSAAIEAAAGGALPEEPASLAALLDKAGEAAPLAALHRVIEAVRARERAERPGAAQEAWTRTRGTVHLVLARRGSRVALYDLRETIEQAHVPLPANFLEAAALVGDPASLEAIANAYASWLAGARNDRSAAANADRAAGKPPRAPMPDPGQDSGLHGATLLGADRGDWPQQLRTAFAAIAEREAIGRRHAVSKRIEARWPEAAADLLSMLSRSKRGSRPASRT